MTPHIVLGRELQQELVRSELLRGPSLSETPKCRIISVTGDDPMLDINRALHVRTLTNFGFDCDEVTLAPGTSRDVVREAIQTANEDPGVDGILFLLPLPPHLSVPEVMGWIAAEKDLEGLHPTHATTLLATIPADAETVAPLVVEALQELLAYADVPLAGQHVVILTEAGLMGRNPVANLVARVAGPAALPLDAPVSVVPIDHPRAAQLSSAADVLVVSLERPEAVSAEFVRKGATVVDFNPILVGIRQKEGVPQPILTGGVDTASVTPVAGVMVPVPGGVGPVMLGVLMRNLVRAARRRSHSKHAAAAT